MALRRLDVGTPPGHVQRHISPPAIPPAHAPSFARSQPPPRRLHVCVSGSPEGPGAVPPGGGVRATSRAAAQSAAGSRPRRWHWGSEGAVLYNAVSGSQRGRKEPSGRKAPSPPLGPGHRVPGPGSFPPPAVAARFVSPAASALRATREGLLPGPHGGRGGGRKGGRPPAGTRGDPGVRLPGRPRDETEEGARAPPPRGAGRGRP